MIGHGLGAAGGLEAIATIKAITTGWVHPTINQDVLQLNVHVFFCYARFDISHDFKMTIVSLFVLIFFFFW